MGAGEAVGVSCCLRLRPLSFPPLLTTLRNNTAAAGRAFLPDEQDAEEKGGRRDLGLDHLMGLCLKGREGRGWRWG